MRKRSELKSLHLNLDAISAGDDGELLSGIFCTECGIVNLRDAVTCIGCGSILAEQGTDLRARLTRIKRYAQGDAVYYISEAPATTRRAGITPKRAQPLDPEQQARLERIAQVARRAREHPSESSSIDFFLILTLAFVYSLFHPLKELFVGRER